MADNKERNPILYKISFLESYWRGKVVDDDLEFEG